jgi:hypothetical protein
MTSSLSLLRTQADVVGFEIVEQKKVGNGRKPGQDQLEQWMETWPLPARSVLRTGRVGEVISWRLRQDRRREPYGSGVISAGSDTASSCTFQCSALQSLFEVVTL